MRLNLSDYPRNKQEFVKWFRRNYWTIGGINSDYSTILDYDKSENIFTSYLTQYMYQAYKFGKFKGKKESE